MRALLEFRHRILMALIDRGLDENVHIVNFNYWNPSNSSRYPKVLVELIRHGLSNFNTSSPASLASILIFEGRTKSTQTERRWDKVLLVLKPLQRLAVSSQMTSQQGETEQCIVRQTKEHSMPEAPIHPIIDGVRNNVPHQGYIALEKGHDELALFQERRRNPLRLCDFARISVRQVVGGQHLVKETRTTPSSFKDEIVSERQLHHTTHQKGIS